MIDSALREKALSDHALLVSLGALVSAHLASERKRREREQRRDDGG